MSEGRLATAILTRPKGRNQALQEALQQQGLHSLVLPALVLEERPDSFDPLLHHPAKFDLVVCVSRLAAQSYLTVLKQHSIVWPAHVRVAGVGQASIVPFRDEHVVSEQLLLYPASDTAQDSEALWQVLQPHLSSVSTVLLVRGQKGREWLGTAFEAAGKQVQRLTAYQRQPAIWTGDAVTQLRDALLSTQCSILFSSSESVAAILDNVCRLGLESHWSKIGGVVIHERIGKRLQSEQEQRNLAPLQRLRYASPSVESMCAAFSELACVNKT